MVSVCYGILKPVLFFNLKTDTNNAAWGTCTDGILYESSDINATFQINGEPLNPQSGAHDLPKGDLQITYPLGESGTKTITFTDDEITVSITHPGPFIETLPFLKETDDTLQIENNSLDFTRNTITLHI